MLELIALLLATASIFLHYIAPRTKNTVDDKALAAVDKAKDLLPKK